MTLKYQKQKSAYITIITVITISVVSVSVVLSLIYSGISSTKNSLLLVRQAQARAGANACLEEALQNIRDDNNYSGSLTFSFSETSCSATTTKISASDFSIASSGFSDGTIKKIRVTTSQTDPKIIVSDWQEVADF